MSDSKFRLEAPIRQRLRALGGKAERTTEREQARTGDTQPASDPLALDPLSPIPVDPATAESGSPFALDPLSPLGSDAG